jgi:hypothetical protein
VSELRDRLERLAGRGTRRGADEVLRAAEQSGPFDVDTSEPMADDYDLEIIDGLPTVTAEPPRRRGSFSTLIAATGVAALVGIGALAVTAVFGSGGGASSPERAVHQLADAVSQRDPLAAVDVLAPTEVRTMRESVQNITRRAAELKLVDDASQPLAGVDLSVDNLQLSSTNLADGYAKVTITGGTISADAHRAGLSKLLQDALRNSDTTDPHGQVDLARLAAGSNLPTFVMTVRQDGRWYVSPVYTALEYLREANDGPPADFGSAHAAQLGSDTPEHAVEDAMHAWQAGDWNRLLALAPPDELPVYDYRAFIDQQAVDTHPDFTINALTTTAEVSGDHGVVKLEGSGVIGSGADRRAWQVGGTCPSIGDWWANSFTSSDGSAQYSPAPPGPSFCLAGDVGRTVPYGLFLATSSADSTASGPISIDVVREDGRWFVSPVGTVLDAIDSFVQHVDERSLYPLIGLGWELPPDGTLTLNQPLRFADAAGSGRVYSFDGQAGQRVIGEIERPAGSFFLASGELYTADGRDLGYIDLEPRNQGCCAFPVELPITGSYRLVITLPLPSDTTLTLWDTDHAPKALLNNEPGLGVSGGEKCTYTATSSSCAGVSVPLQLPTQIGVSGGSNKVTTTSVP